MAEGRSVGTIFVELDLDPSRYTKGQQQLLRDATTTSLNIEQNFKNLGINSAASLDLMRQKAQNSFDMIANSSKSSADDIVRAEQAKNDKLTSLNQQQFGQQTSFLSTLKANWIAASAIVYSAMKLVGEGMDLMTQGAKALQSEEAFKNVASAYHVNADAMLADLQRLTHGTVDSAALMQTTMKGMSAGLSEATMKQIAEIAPLAARRTGEDVSEAYKNIENAIETMRSRALVAYGLLNKQEALWIQKLQAEGAEYNMMPLVMANYTLELARIGKGEDLATEALQRHKAAWTEFKDTAGKDAVNILGTLAGWWDKLTTSMAKTDLQGQIANLRSMQAIQKDPALRLLMQNQIEQAQGSLAGLSPASAAAPGMSVSDAEAVKKQKDAELRALAFANKTRALNDQFEAWKITIANLNPYLTETDKEMAKLSEEGKKLEESKGGIPGIAKSAVDAQLAIAKQNMALKEGVETQKLYAAELEKGQQAQGTLSKDYEALYKQWGGQRLTSEQDTLAKINAAQREAAGKALDLLYTSFFDVQAGEAKRVVTFQQYQDLLTSINEKSERERAAEIAKNTAARATVAAQEQLSAIELQKKQLIISPAQANAAELAVNQTLLQNYKDEALALHEGDQNWLSIQEKIKATQKLVNDLTVASKDFTGTMAEGWTRGATEYAYSVKTSFQAGQELAKVTTASMEKNFTDFFDASSKGFLDFGKLAINVLEDINRELIKVMLVQPLVKGITGGSSSALSAISALLGIGASGTSSGGAFTSMGQAQGTFSSEALGGYYHSGGMPWEPTGSRMVSLSAFYNARRAHTGMGPDELPVVISKKEGVFTPGQMQALGLMAKGSPQPGQQVGIHIPIIINGQMDRSAEVRLRKGLENYVRDFVRSAS